MQMTIGGQESFDLPGVVPAEMEPGVVLLHHVMVLHGSVRNRRNSLRRAIYFESRSLSWNQEFLWYYDETMEKRCLLYQHALAERRANPYAPDDESFAYGLTTPSSSSTVTLTLTVVGRPGQAGCTKSHNAHGYAGALGSEKGREYTSASPRRST
jgi:hypothetical protein